MSSAEQFYEQLQQIFSNRDNQVLEFEIVPPAFGSFLQDGNSIGIGKKPLAQAFIIARQKFFCQASGAEVGRAGAESGVQNGASGDGFTDDCAIATEIMLLFDCEHLTACNWRKRRIAALMEGQSCMDTSQKERHARLIELLQTERTLMATYLCSRLHRHTKSPTLWHHRFWVVKQLVMIQYGDCARDVRIREAVRGLLEDEFEVVLRAAELHPRNYYAFSYMRQLHVTLSQHLEKFELVGDDTDDCPSVLARWMVDRCQRWCLTEPRDISGWTFLLYILDAASSEEMQRDTISKVVQFALHVGWEGESLWTFIDLAARKFPVLQTLQSFGLLGNDGDSGMLVPGGKTSTATFIFPKSWRSWSTRARTLWSRDQVREDA
ncbi:conserved hypothetical protein [Paecilomyces variotii No. 5]|uniref:Protein prenyltransferase n=1 Tax=Byssochlamys spectabilis (strain No. 5 / NBRC 109023) TaxID=1356009 RepID=V5FDU4_BYSSN|nr:conserved hypothetical protein [Paecilomyces variotii No. 5]